MTAPDPFAVLGVLVVCAVLAYAVRPMLRLGDVGRGDSSASLVQAETAAQAEEERLLDEREAAVRALSELDFDRRLGNLGDAEYREMHDRYRQRAVAALRALDGHEPELDLQIEQAVMQHRVSRQAGGTSSALAAPTAVRPRVPRRIGGYDTPSRGVPAPRRRQTWSVAAVGLAVALAAAVSALSLGRGLGPDAAVPLTSVSGAEPRGLTVVGQAIWMVSATGLLFSRDGGQHWVPPNDAPGPAQALHATPAGLWYAATPQGVYRTNDRGWERASEAPDPRLVALSGGQRESTVYAASADGRFFESDDRASSWTQRGHLPASPTSLAVIPGAPDLILAATDGGGVLASIDAGRTWSPANGFANGLLESTRVYALAFDANSGNTASGPTGRSFSGALYAATDRGISRSIDAGAAWTRLPLRGNFRALAVAATGKPGPLYAIDVQGRLYRSFDRGISWPGE